MDEHQEEVNGILKEEAPAEVKKIPDNQLDIHDKQGTDFLGKLGDIVKKILDCCKE